MNEVIVLEELKPCPFCGREVELKHIEPFDFWCIDHKEREPLCYLWHQNGYQGKKEDLIALWNERVLR